MRRDQLSAVDAKAHARSAAGILDNLSRTILGRQEQLRTVLVGCLSGGHVLIEDVPGTGKTLLAETWARSLNVPLQRIQFSVDLLPSDLLGTSIFDPSTGTFGFHPGPLAGAHVVLVDDINRARPSTQAALLEAMAEGQVSVEGHTYRLASPFMLLATQNPAQQEGTFPLPAAELDRFAVCVHLGYPPRESELAMLDRLQGAEARAGLNAVMDLVEWHHLQAAVRRVSLLARAGLCHEPGRSSAGAPIDRAGSEPAAPARLWRGPARRWPFCRAGRMSSPTTSRRSSGPCWPTGCGWLPVPCCTGSRSKPSWTPASMTSPSRGTTGSGWHDRTPDAGGTPQDEGASKLIPILWTVMLVIQLAFPYRGWVIMLVGLGGAWLLARLWARSLAEGLNLERETRFHWSRVRRPNAREVDPGQSKCLSRPLG